MAPRTLDLFKAVNDSDIASVREFLHSDGNVNTFNENGENALNLAIRTGDLGIIEILCNNGAHVNLTSHGVNTPLMEAVSARRLCVVEILCEKGADVNAVNDKEFSPLMWIAEDDDFPIAQLLIEKHKADVNHQNKRGVSVLMNAADKGFTKNVQVLIDNGASINHTTKSGWSALLKASKTGHFETVEILLRNGADVKQITKDKWNALMLACYKPCHRIAQILVDAGVELNLINSKGFSPLMYACHNGELETVKLLLDNGAELNIIANDGMTALQLARLSGNYELINHILTYGDAHKRLLIEAVKKGNLVRVVRTLVACGVDVNTTSRRQKSVLMMASQLGNIEAVRIILERPDILINAADGHGWNSLMFAAFGGHYEVVSELLHKGADVNTRNSKGNNSLLIATDKSLLTMVQLLLRYGSDVNYANKDGWTAVMLAAQNGASDILHVLLQNQATADLSNNQGQTALMLASEHGFDSVIKVLLSFTENRRDATPSLVDISEDNLEKRCAVDVNKTNNDGETSLVIACKNGHEKVVEILIKKGSNINHRSGNGMSPLKAAVSCGNIHIVVSLLNSEADVDVADDLGDTPLIIAAKHQNKSVAEILMKHNPNLGHQNNSSLTALDISEKNGSKEIVDMIQKIINYSHPVTRDETRSTGQRSEPESHEDHQSCVSSNLTADVKTNSKTPSSPSSVLLEISSEQEGILKNKESQNDHEMCKSVIKDVDAINALPRHYQNLEMMNIESELKEELEKTDGVKQSGTLEHNKEDKALFYKRGILSASSAVVPGQQANHCEKKNVSDKYDYSSGQQAHHCGEKKVSEQHGHSSKLGKRLKGLNESFILENSYENVMKELRNTDSGSKASENTNEELSGECNSMSSIYDEIYIQESRSDEMLKQEYSEFSYTTDDSAGGYWTNACSVESLAMYKDASLYQDSIATTTNEETCRKLFTGDDDPSETSKLLDSLTSSTVETDCLEIKQTELGPVSKSVRLLQSGQTSFVGPSRSVHLDEDRPRNENLKRNNIIIGTAEVLAFEQSHLKCAAKKRRGILKPRSVPLEIDARITQPLLCNQPSSRETDSSYADDTIYETVGHPIESMTAGVDLWEESTKSSQSEREQYPKWVNDIIQALNKSSTNGSTPEKPMQLSIHYDATVHNVTIPSTQFCAINNSTITTTNEGDPGNKKDLTFVRGKKEPLSPEDDLTIRKNYAYLKRALNPILVAEVMCREGIFDTNDMQDITRPRSMKRKTDVLLHKMLNAGTGDAFDVFMGALEDVHPRVVERLKTSSLEEMTESRKKKQCSKCCVQ